MLRHIDSFELAEWEAYERANGPLDNKWTALALNAIYEQLQLANRIEAAKRTEDVPEPVPLPPPTDYFRDEESRGVDPLEDDDDEEWDDGYEEL
jgi:hypothetical protein